MDAETPVWRMVYTYADKCARRDRIRHRVYRRNDGRWECVALYGPRTPTELSALQATAN